jgi:hypothetical protein
LASRTLTQTLFTLAGGEINESAALAAPNDTLIAALVECLTSSWTCDLMNAYTGGERIFLEDYLGGRVNFVGSSEPPSYYTDVIYATGGRLPVLQHTDENGQAHVYTSYDAAFDADNDLVYLLPNQFEVMLGLLSYT